MAEQSKEQKKTPTRPLPKLTEMDTAPFWLATKGKAPIGQKGHHGHTQQRQGSVHGEEHDGGG